MMNYRDYVAMGMISSWFAAKWMSYNSQYDDNEWTFQRVYTDDESDQSYKLVTNKTDGAVKRERAVAYAEKIRSMRAEREREMALDAYNYLYQTNHQA